jgi:endonuclease YncB( thermonuclease family)
VPPHSSRSVNGMGGWGLLLATGLVLGSVCGTGAEDARAGRDAVIASAPAPACRFDEVGGGRVAKIVDGRSFLLEDGRQVRLAAIEVPLLPATAGNPAQAQAALAARGALETMLAGTSVELRHRGLARDRYDRTLAYVYFAADGERSAAHDMLARGFARVAPQVGHADCAAELLARERAARTAKVGLWADSVYDVLGAESLAELLAERGRFAVVEGRVVSVRESGGTIYMNFGRRWSQALTVTVAKRNERVFAGAGLQLKTLENRRVRVRGYVEERSGPRIEATRPEQIEIAELN